MNPRVLALAGPTGVGKTALVSRLDPDRYELVSVDSCQIYRHTTIASAAPDWNERRLHRYHLVDLLDPARTINAWAFRRWMLHSMREIWRRKKTPVLVGGTVFYFKVLFEPDQDHSPQVHKPMHFLRRLEARHPGVAWQILQRRWPERARQIHPNDLYRVFRSLDRPKQVFLQKPAIAQINFDALKLEVTMPRDEHYAQINRRMDQMLASGLLDEYRNLRKMGYGLTDPGLKSLGYQFIDQYQQGKIAWEELEFKLKQSHRRYAKRQVTFLKTKLSFEKVDGKDVPNVLEKIKNWEI